MSLYVVLDWQCFYKISSGCHAPKSVTLHQGLCPCCSFDVGDKVGGWRGQPWFMYAREDEKTALLLVANMTIHQCLYDPMHGVPRLVSGSFCAFYIFSQKNKLYKIIRAVCEHVPWFKQKCGETSIKETKHLFGTSETWNDCFCYRCL